MKETELIQIALMLTPPWQVAQCDIDVNRKHVDIHLNFDKGADLPVLNVGPRSVPYMTQKINPGGISIFFSMKPVSMPEFHASIVRIAV